MGSNPGGNQILPEFNGEFELTELVAKVCVRVPPELNAPYAVSVGFEFRFSRFTHSLRSFYFEF